MAPRDGSTPALPHAPSNRRTRRRVVRPRGRDPDVRAAAAEPDLVVRARSHRARTITPFVPAVGGTGPADARPPNRHPFPPAAPRPKPRRRREPSRGVRTRARPPRPRLSPPRHPRGDDHPVPPSPSRRRPARLAEIHTSRDPNARPGGDARVRRGSRPSGRARHGRRVWWHADRRARGGDARADRRARGGGSRSSREVG